MRRPSGADFVSLGLRTCTEHSASLTTLSAESGEAKSAFAVSCNRHSWDPLVCARLSSSVHAHSEPARVMAYMQVPGSGRVMQQALTCGSSRNAATACPHTQRRSAHRQRALTSSCVLPAQAHWCQELISDKPQARTRQGLASTQEAGILSRCGTSRTQSTGTLRTVAR